MPALPPASLYVHIPWCVRKCPYCDFNSHNRPGEGLPELAYTNALIEDLDCDLPLLQSRRLQSVFFGGGTPSLFAAESIHTFLQALRDRGLLEADAEITLEANPGTAERQRFRDYADAGVNRLSIGVQSFSDALLRNIGRIHSAAEAHAAIEMARAAGFDSFNIDLMYGLPDQSPLQLSADINAALEHQPAHISWYQLTIEPNTVFHRRPPQLPDEDATEDAWLHSAGQLAGLGYENYETSAWSQPGYACRHNLNYWRFGDYLGVGAGAHGKITQDGKILRTRKTRQPDAYLVCDFSDKRHTTVVPEAELPGEFLMNALRLGEPFSAAQFEQRTGLSLQCIAEFLHRARDRGLMHEDQLQVTPLGRRYLNELLALL